MPSRRVIQSIVAIAALVWLVGLSVEGVEVEWSWMRLYSGAVSAAVLCWITFDRWLWRAPGIRRLVKHPILIGTWKGELRTDWKDPATGQKPGPIETYLVIRQTFSDITVTMMTKESSSKSLSVSLDGVADCPEITYTYRNNPKLSVQGRSRIHHGSARLEAHGTPVSCLEGSYWTDRGTTGEMEFTERVSDCHTRFLSAAEALSSAANADPAEDSSSPG